MIRWQSQYFKHAKHAKLAKGYGGLGGQQGSYISMQIIIFPKLIFNK